MTEEHITLYCTDNGSDKVYSLHLFKDPSGSDNWCLNYENGKRGAAMKAKEKKPPAPYAQLKKVFDATVAAKTKDGYTPNVDGVRYQGTDIGERFTGMAPQLLKVVVGDRLAELLDDPDMLWQEKMDGERRPIRKCEDGCVIGAQREGLAVPIPMILADAVNALPIAFCDLDGEDMGDGRYAAFDLLSCPEDPLGQRPYIERFQALIELLQKASSPCWIAVPTAYTPQEAKALLLSIKERKGEGLVGKLKRAPHRPGESDNQVKAPFVERASFFVSAHNPSARSVFIAVVDENGATLEKGKVTVPENYAVPAVGVIVDVEYLYANRTGGIQQPRYKGERGDRRLEHCLDSKLKYKGDLACTLLCNELEEDAEESVAMTMQ
jgi:hypothetical protein